PRSSRVRPRSWRRSPCRSPPPPGRSSERRRGEEGQWIWAVADRDSPVGDGALRIGRRRFGERLNAVRIVERMDERDAAVELLLRLRRARGLEMNAAEILRESGRGERAR